MTLSPEDREAMIRAYAEEYQFSYEDAVSIFDSSHTFFNKRAKAHERAWLSGLRHGMKKAAAVSREYGKRGSGQLAPLCNEVADAIRKEIPKP